MQVIGKKCTTICVPGGLMVIFYQAVDSNILLN